MLNRSTGAPRILLVELPVILGVAMPHYEFFSADCQKFFYKILSVVEYEEGEIVCPYCDGRKIEQRRSSHPSHPLKKSA